MSTIAALKVEKQTFDVRRLDVLVWNLEGIAKLQRLIVDITLVIKSTTESLGTLDLLVPFRVRQREDWESLYENVVVSDLTMPGVSGGQDSVALKTITYDAPIGEVLRRRFEMTSVKPNDSKPKGQPWLDRMSKRSPAWSIERLTLSEPLAQDEQAIFRIRYHVYPPTGLVLWKRSGFGINGAFFEARTGAGALHRKDPIPALLEERSMTCEAVSMTFVLRSSLQIRLGTSQPKVIDGRQWEDYLERFTDLRREGALVAYTRPSTPEDKTEESQLFLDVSREFGLLPFGNYLRIGILTLAILAFARWTGLLGPGNYVGVPWMHLFHLAGHYVAQIFIVAGVGAAGLIASRIEKSAALLKGVRNRWHRFDRWFWRFLWKQTK
jgi:hypothetical protein